MANDYQGEIKDFAMVVPVPVILRKDQIRTVHHNIFDKIDAATIAKYKPSGKKFVALGHDGSSAGKSAAVNHQVDKLKKGGYYVEVSGKMRDIFIAKGLEPVTDEATVRRALKGKELKWNEDGSYDRKIGGTIHTKMMFGKPK